MARAKKHKDVEFVVGNKHLSSLAEALTLAVMQSLSNGKKATLDVLVHSRSGARWYAGDEGVAEYNEDPEASVFDRLQISASSQGRIP